ncbi:MAG: hypothetical protein JWN75_467 [Candidatus Saccharibacteria bacterium]|nr:hypothetical protein [Candidatus Saccharibacteria bacterium]
MRKFEDSPSQPVYTSSSEGLANTDDPRGWNTIAAEQMQALMAKVNPGSSTLSEQVTDTDAAHSPIDASENVTHTAQEPTPSLDEELIANTELAADAAEQPSDAPEKVDHSDKEIAKFLEAEIAAVQGEINPVAEKEAVKVVKVKTGRAAANRTISNNKISRFFDRIGINSDEQRAKDGALAKKLRAGREERKANGIDQRIKEFKAAREAVAEPSVETPSTDAEAIIERENREIAAVLEARTYAEIAERKVAERNAVSAKNSHDTRTSRYAGSTESKNTKKKRTWLEKLRDRNKSNV